MSFWRRQPTQLTQNSSGPRWEAFERLKGRGNIATAEDIFYCFRLLLGRDPNREEWTGHTQAIGQPLDEVAKVYASSLEFAQRELSVPVSRIRPIFTTFKEFGIYVDDADPYIGAAIQSGCYEPEIESVFRAYLKPGMKVLDVGANVGFFTMLSAMLVGPQGRVIAVEPNPTNVKLLEASRRRNGFEHVEVHCVAASDQAGILSFNPSFSNGTAIAVQGSIERVLSSHIVPSIELDRLIEGHIDLVKIDVEGAEYRVLKGLEATLQRSRPTIISEFTPGAMPGMSGATGMEYLLQLRRLGYSVSVVEHKGPPTLCSNDSDVMAIHQSRGVDHVDLLLTPSGR